MRATDETIATGNGTTLTMVQSLQSGAGSGVYLVERTQERPRSEPTNPRKAMNPLFEHVTLVVYGWKNVEPGTLSWVFPSVSAAVAAARAMTNAVRWAIVAGKRETTESDTDGARTQADAKRTLDEARASGAVLIEQTG